MQTSQTSFMFWLHRWFERSLRCVLTLLSHHYLPSCTLQSISFSGPGWVHSKNRHGTTTNSSDPSSEMFPEEEYARNFATIFMADKDIIPRIDKHVGDVYYTKCRHSDSLSCHSMNEMVCDLLRSCGDGQDNTRFQHCSSGDSKAERLYDEATKILAHSNELIFLVVLVVLVAPVYFLVPEKSQKATTSANQQDNERDESVGTAKSNLSSSNFCLRMMQDRFLNACGWRLFIYYVI